MPPGVEKTSRLGSGDPVASGVKCGPHGGKNSGTKSWMVSWLSLKTKVEPGLRGSRVMSGDWRRQHRVRGVCSGSPENNWFTRLSHKTEAEDLMRRCGHPDQSNRPEGAVRPPGRSNCPGGTVWPPGSQPPRSFKAEDTRRDHKSCVEAKQVAVAGHPSDGENLKTSKFSLEGLVSLVIK
jgi:hypothetical protein